MHRSEQAHRFRIETVISKFSHRPPYIERPKGLILLRRGAQDERFLMAARTTVLPKAAVASLFADVGAPRVAKDAVDELVVELEKRGVEIAAKAWRIAQHAGRKTLTGEDIKVARQ